MARPNVILITIDGMGWHDLGSAGNGIIRTPNLDALASHGVRFSQATTSASHDAAGRTTPPDGMGAAVNTMAHALRAQDYTVGAVGAALLDPAGCDLHALTGVVGQPDVYRAESDSEGVPPEVQNESQHVTSWTGNQAVRFCQGAEEPFLLNVGFTTEVPPPEPWRSMYRPEQMVPLRPQASPATLALQRKRLAHHYGAIGLLDRQIGRMMATLTARGRTNNVFVATGTRGFDSAPSESDVPPLSEAKVRVPLLVGGILQQRRGEHDPALVCANDVAATVLEALAVPPEGRLESRSFLAQLRAAGRPHRKAVVIHGDGGVIAVRTARYKWVTGGGRQGEWLFDLQSDPLERENLVHTRQAIPIRKMLTGLV